MSRDSSPALVDPFADTEIQAAIRALPEPHHSWRRALPGASDLVHVRAKSIRLGETARPSLSRENHVTTSRVDSIEGNHDSRPARPQWPQFEQYQATAIEKRLLAELEKIQPATPTELAPRIKQSINWTTKRLAKLSAKHLVVGRPGRGGGYSAVK